MTRAPSQTAGFRDALLEGGMLRRDLQDDEVRSRGPCAWQWDGAGWAPILVGAQGTPREVRLQAGLRFVWLPRSRAWGRILV